MTVSTSTHLTILNKVVESNKCPLKISLVEIPQEIPTEVEDDTVINILVTDYSGQEYNFIMKSNVPHDILASRNSARTKLLITHQNIENLEKKSKNLVSPEYLNSKFRTEESNKLVGCNTEEGCSIKVDKDGKKGFACCE
ncbi:2313_t:CDS:2 [Diversispora eburnea]|uniref:2313_t:CDS:1 n=1 Tax=Diversispora eburnea TaxID=1213867 RepID=A0A9N9G011_9GLOM|nr:2313_t:CDS:2 [Diversispora eburnea]